MPEAIPAIIAGAKAAYDGAVAFVASGLASAGVETAAAAAIATTAVNLTISTALSVGVNAAARSQIPGPELAQQNRKQAIPDRLSAYGRVRLGGAYMLFEVDREFFDGVYALHDGMVDGFEQIYLNDDKVTVTGGFVQSGAGLRYGKFSDLVRIDTRRGLPTETRYSQITDTSIWPAEARGDGIASLMMIAKAGGKELFLRDYPNGRPEPNAVTRAQLCYDPRLGARGTITSDADKLASATWQWTMNPVLQLLDYMTNPETGMGLDFARYFLPRIADWVEAANVCDETVNGAPRYQSSGSYFHSTPPADVITTFRSTFDGWISQDTNGAFTVQAGKYYAPTVTITDDHIVGMSRQFFQEDENAINEVTISFTDPTADYVEVDTDPWRDEDDIDARGEVRTSPLSLPWVPAADQARRLAKIMVARQTAPIRGSILTTLDGLRAWAERRIRIQAPSDSAVMADIVVDVEGVALNPDMTVSISFVQSIPSAYSWGAGDVVTDPTRPEVEAIPTPIIVDDGILIDGGTPRLFIVIDNIDRPDFDYVIYWRTTGADTFVRETPSYIRGSGDIVIRTGPLPTQQDIEYYVTTISSGGRESEPTATVTVASGGVDPTNPFRVELSSSAVIGTRSGAGEVTTASVTVTVFGNEGTPTIVWDNIGGDIGAFAVSDTSFTTTFRTTIEAGAAVQATFKASVTDPVLGITVETLVGAGFIDNTT